LREFVEKAGLGGVDHRVCGFERVPGAFVDLGEGNVAAGTAGPFEFDEVAHELARVEFTGDGPGMNEFAAFLADGAKGLEMTGEADAGLFMEFTDGSVERGFAGIEFAFWDGPGAGMLVTPKRAAGVDEKYFDRGRAIKQNSGGLSGYHIVMDCKESANFVVHLPIPPVCYEKRPIQGEEPPELMRHQKLWAGPGPVREFSRFLLWIGVLMLPVLHGMGQCTVYPAGIKDLAVISVTDTSVTFHWSKVTPQQTYYNFVVTTDSSYTGYPGDTNFVHFYHFQPDTVATQDSLLPGTRYYIFVFETRCSAMDSVSFVTLGSRVNGCAPGSVPTPVITSATGSFTVCGSGGLVLNSSSTTGSMWYMNGQLVDSGASSLLVTQSGNYTLAVLYPNGCKDTSAVQEVVLDPGPLPPVLTVAGSLEICSGSTVGLYSSSATGNQWYKGSLALPGETGSEYLADSAGVYWVQVTDEFGCRANSAQVTVTINPASVGDKVTPTISPTGPLLLCADSTVLLIASKAVNYQWFWDGDAIPGADGDTLAVNLNGEYTVATGTAGCGSIGALSAPVEITYIDQIQPVITLVSGVLWSSAPSGNQWYLNGHTIRGATNQQYTPRTTGSYTVRVGVGVMAVDTTTFQIGVGGCYSAFSLPWVIADSNLVAPQVSVFPNPVSSVLTLVSKAAGPVTVRVFNLMGQQVFTGQELTGTTEVDVSSWGKGVYFLQIIDERSQLQEKKVVVKL